MKQTLELRQSLRMTPQLQQAIKLLQLSRLELETAIRKELQENPILEESAELSDESPTPEVTSETVEQQDPRQQDEFEWENYVDGGQRSTSSGGGSPLSDEIMNYENVISSPQSLQDHLLWQVSLSGFNEEEEYIARILISYINDDGYVIAPLENIAEDEGVAHQDLIDVLPFVQEFDPPGVGARDLKECLLIQAKHLEEDTHDIIFLINNHLKDLEKKNYASISKAMDRQVEDVIDMCRLVCSMDPKPGRAFSAQDTHYVTPDVYVYKVGDRYVVSLNEDGLPRLRISNFYKNVLKGGKANEMTQEYIQSKLRSAIWLIKSIHQRQRTIYKVAESIVRHQGDFFDHGPSQIKPMILRDIASDIGMHESTVSRVTTSKYMHTPQGIFELKYFFNSGISTTDGESLASESVKLKIKALIDAEDPRLPLSDQKLVEILHKDGIQIARRTIAKYRDSLKILPSSRRKKYF